MQEPKFTREPLHVIDQGEGKFPIVCGEGGEDAWVAVVNCGPNAMANAQLFAAASGLYAESDASRSLLVIAAGYLERAHPESAATMRKQALELSKALAKARGEE